MAAAGHPHPAATELLIQRVRAGLWIVLVATALFALADLGIDPTVFGPVYALKGLLALIVLLLFLPLRGAVTHRRARVVGLVSVNATYVLMATMDGLKGHLETTPLLAVVCCMTTAALIPWGVRAQSTTAAVAWLGNLVTLGLSGRSFDAMVDPAASVTVSLAISVYVAHVFERHRREQQHATAVLAERAQLEALRADVRLSAIEQRGLRPSLQSCCEIIVRRLDAAFARIWTLSADGQSLELQASAGMYTHIDGGHARVGVGQLKIGRIAAERAPHLTNAVLEDPRIGDPAWARREGMVAFAGYPLLVDDRLVGVVAMFARRPLSVATLEGLESVAHTIAMHIERVRSEEARARLVEELERSNRLKSEFVSTMSHELRTPLNVIAGYLEMLEDPEWSDRTTALGRMRHATRDLLEMVEATLDLNRLDSGRDEPEVEDIRLDELWRELEGEFAGLCSARAALTWQPVNGLVLRTDRRKLRTVLKNLVGNAVKFSPGGQVLVSCEADPVSCTLTVRDTGIGIPAEQLPYIFEMFRQVDSSDRRAYGGVGLGLHIVDRLCKQIAGEVHVESAVGRGSTFTVRLPLAGPAAVAAA